MKETVVHVTTLEQWKSVLDVWFARGYKWNHIDNKRYMENIFNNGAQYLIFDNKYIRQSFNNFCERPIIEYQEFMAQQKEDNNMAMVYEVSQSVFDALQRIKAHEGTSLIGSIVLNGKFIKSIEIGNKAILRYLADDPAIEFKVKETLYRLWRDEMENDIVYMTLNNFGTPNWTMGKENAFKAPLEEIKKWQTPAWSLEKVD